VLEARGRGQALVAVPGPPSSTLALFGSRPPSAAPSRGKGQGSNKPRPKKAFQRSAPEEFLIFLDNLRRSEGEGEGEGEGAAEGDREIGETIKLARALLSDDPAQAAASAAVLAETLLMDIMIARMLVSASTRANSPDLGLRVLAGMYKRSVRPDPFIATLVLKASAEDGSWAPVAEEVRRQLSERPEGGAPLGRQHEGFTRVLAAAVKRGKFYSGSFLVDMLLSYRMITLFTTKVRAGLRTRRADLQYPASPSTPLFRSRLPLPQLALTFFRFSKTPSRGLAWIREFRAQEIRPDADLDFEVGRVYKSLNMTAEAVGLLGDMLVGGRPVEDRHVGVVLSACSQTGGGGRQS
jgi:hypothetical protein